MKYFAIITGGGIGSRMGNTIPKQFLPLDGIPIMMHTIRHFQVLTDTIFVTLPKQWFPYWEELQQKHDFDIPHTLIEGGYTRFESVKSAVAHLPEKGLVAIHDAVRPLVSSSFLQSCFDFAENHGNAVVAVSIKDSLRMNVGTKTKAVDRNDFFAVQTPQVFPCEVIKKAYQQAYQPYFTDDATLVESLGYDIKLVQGDESNLKITTADDLLMAECFFTKKYNNDESGF